jgi:hypothetical protein
MAYSVISDIRYSTGVVIGDYDDATITALIGYADAEINAKLLSVGISGGGGDVLKAASIKYATAWLLTRMRTDGTKPESLSLDKISMGDDIDKAIENLRKDAEMLISLYIKTSTTISKHRRYLRVLNRGAGGMH